MNIKKEVCIMAMQYRTKQKIMEMLSKGLTQREIQKKTGISLGKISTINKECKGEIQNLRVAMKSALKEEYTTKVKDMYEVMGSIVPKGLQIINTLLTECIEQGTANGTPIQLHDLSDIARITKTVADISFKQEELNLKREMFMLDKEKFELMKEEKSFSDEDTPQIINDIEQFNMFEIVNENKS